MKRRTLFFPLFYLLLTLPAAFTGPPAAEGQLSGSALVEALREGGYTIYFRHSPTDWSQSDQVSAAGDWVSCDPAKMRQLSDRGREQARRIGDALERLDIPVGRVLSSEYCRARETAELMDLGEVVPTRAIMNMRAAHLVGGRDAVVERARSEIGRKPGEGTNSVIVAHGNLMRAATGEYTGEGGAAVFLPEGKGAFRLVARVSAEEWTRFADRFGR
jgi:broad specificity phosphatase PhoE